MQGTPKNGKNKPVTDIERHPGLNCGNYWQVMFPFSLIDIDFW